jgi:hypothetical protein
MHPELQDRLSNVWLFGCLAVFVLFRVPRCAAFTRFLVPQIYSKRALGAEARRLGARLVGWPAHFGALPAGMVDVGYGIWDMVAAQLCRISQ